METLKQKVIKGYELKEKLGTGGFGAVYRAYQHTVGREVAIKIILPALANQIDFIRRFEGEAQLVARLEHPHITPLYDYWRDPEGAYLVMRWLRGGSLRDALSKGKFELRTAALLLDQIAGALSLAHRNGIIHRDIKPANILLDEDGNAYLTDFGIAKDLSINNNSTAPDMIVGSLDYISPEQARSETVSSRTDIYSLGVTLYEMIVGEHPFSNMSSVERLYKHINDPLPEITGFENAAEINRVIQKATAKNPEERYPDALAFAADFREAIGLNRASTTVVELLTQREQEILQLIIEGLSNKEIAQRLTITHGTVKWYVNQIYEKLGVRSRVQAMVRARELNLVVKGSAAIDSLKIATEDFQPENPYKGLRAFQSADCQDFFGREKLIAKLLKRMCEKTEFGRFLAVVGPSGSGKSSLVSAGLIPALWRGELPGSEKWFIVEMTPATRPLDELEIALTKLAANHAANLHEHLQRDANGLLRAASLILPNDSSELLLVIDQFEEAFTMSDDEAARKHFLDLLYAAVTDAKSRVRIVISLRADFYDRPLHYPNFGEMLKNRLETILPLSAEELESAISKPSERVGLVFESGLVASIVTDMNYQAGALPLLQYALTELFEHRQGHLLSREAYEAIGKSTGALAKRSEEIYGSFDEAGKQAARQLFLRLVTVTEGAEDTRRRTKRSEILALGDADTMEEVIDSYVAYRLLTLDHDPISREPSIELAHEAILYEWERLRNWLNESRDDLRIHRQLASMSKDWIDAQHDKSFLARGSRLSSFEQWAESSQLLLTPLEQKFIAESVATRELEAEKEAQQQARENVLKRRSLRFLRLLVAVLVLALVGAFAFALVVMNERNLARSERDNARSLALASAAQLSFNQGDVLTAVSMAAQANQIVAEPSFLAQQVLYNVSTGYGVRRFFPNPPDTSFAAMSLSENDQYLAAIDKESRFYLWNVQTAELQFSTDGLLDGYYTGFLSFSHDNHYVVASIVAGEELQTRRTSCIVYNTETGEELARLDSNQENFWICNQFLNDGRIFIWGRQRPELMGLLGFWDWQNNSLSSQPVPEIDENHSFHVAPSRLGDFAVVRATGYLLNTDVLWLWKPETPSHTEIDANTTNLLLLFNPDGYSFVSVDVNYTSSHTGTMSMNVWRTGTEALVWSVVEQAVALDYNYNGRYLLTSNYANEFKLRDAHTGEELATYGFSMPTFNLSYGTAMFASLYGDGIALLEFQDNLSETLIPRSGDISAVLLNSDASVLAVARGAMVQVYEQNAEQYEPVDHLFYRSSSVLALQETQLSNDGRRLLSRYMGLWRVYDIETGEEILKTEGIMGDVGRFSPDASLMAVLQLAPQFDEAVNDTFHLVDIETGEVLSHISTNIYGFGERSFAITGDNRYLVVGLYSGNVVVYDIATGQSVKELAGNGSMITALSLNADSTKIYAATGNSNLLIWELASGERLKEFERIGLVVGIQVSRDEQRISLELADNTVEILDSNWGIVMRSITIPNSYTGARILDDGSALIYLAADGSVVRQNLLMNSTSLMDWVLANRYVAPLRCEQRALYQIEPLCDN